jgi:hypothetical protein
MEEPEDDGSPLGFCHGFSAAYDEKRDGPLSSYIEARDGTGTFTLFKGFEHFDMLRREGWLAPNMSVIRVMWNTFRGDEHFGVTEDFQLEGIENRSHGGRPGIHDPRTLLAETPPFEAQRLWGPAWHAANRVREEAELSRLRALGLLDE